MRLILIAAIAMASLPSVPDVSPAAHHAAAASASEVTTADHYYYAKTSPSDNSPRKTVTVTCPAGLIVYGFGGSAVNSDGHVALTGIIPNEGLTSVTATAQARGGWTGIWAVMAVATCWLPGGHALQRVVSPPSAFGSAQASCPGEKILYSDGYVVSARTGTPFVDKVVPAPDQSSVFVHGGGVPVADLTVEAVALCGNRIDGALPYYKERTESTVPVSAATTTTAIAPSPVIQLEGLNWVFGAGASSTRPGMFIDALGPGPELGGGWARMSRGTTVAAAGLTAGAGGTTQDDSVIAYGVCIGTWY